MTLHHHHPPLPPTSETKCRQNISCYWPDFDQTLKVGSWEHLEKSPTVTVTFVQAIFVLTTLTQFFGGLNFFRSKFFLTQKCFRPEIFWDICWHLSISGISQLILTRFWPNIKGRFLGPSLTDSKCHGDICTGNICPDNFFPYQE